MRTMKKLVSFNTNFIFKLKVIEEINFFYLLLIDISSNENHKLNQSKKPKVIGFEEIELTILKEKHFFKKVCIIIQKIS